MQLLPHHQHFVVDMGLDYYASSQVLPLPLNINPTLLPNEGHQGGGAAATAALDYSSSPVLPPQAASAAAAIPTKKPVSKFPTPPSLNYLARTSDGIAGRKRSRDDTEDPRSEEELEASSRPTSMEVRPAVEPILGPGMTLIYLDNPSLNISPESQSGTWMEEKADRAPAADRPILTARKSQRRLDAGSVASVSDQQAHIDPIVRQLGIGWKQFPENQNLGLGGLETFVRRKFGLIAPRILLHHEGMALYVVRSSPASAQGYWHQFWLFRDDLKSCRFLSNDESDLFRRLGNKVRDDRGNWLPDILTQGPDVFPTNDDAPKHHHHQTAGVLVPNSGFAGGCDMQQQRWQQQQTIEDVEMECVA